MGKNLGLNIFPVVGYHYAVADEGSPFARIMRQLGIQRPTDVPTLEPGEKPKGNYFGIGKERKGRSSLTKWVCGCGQNAWIGAAEYAAHCDRCGNEFVKATALREMLKELANTLPDDVTPEPEPEKPKFTVQGFDIDAEIDRKQEEDDDWRNPTWADEWEDLDSYMERNFGE